MPKAADQDRPRSRSSRGRSRLRPHGPRSDRGSGAVEIAILAFYLLLFTFISIQTAFVFYARTLAMAAATQGVHAARGYQNDPATGPDKARSFLGTLGWGLMEPRVTMTSSGTDITIIVTGKAPSVLPGMQFSVTQRAHGPVERFTS